MKPSTPAVTAPEKLSPEAQKLLTDFRSRRKMWWFYLQRLPTLIFWGVRIQKVTPRLGQTTIPYSWRTKNPFRSTYFAAQCGAAELSTGVLAIFAVQAQSQPVSMLITRVEADFSKKAVSTITFTCEQGEAIKAVVDEAVATGNPVTYQATSIGVQENGEEVSRMRFTWSFKAKAAR